MVRIMLLGIKRIYDKVELTDGKRVLVDGLWPRGVRRSTANIDEWMKDVAPSKKLRMWFSHDPEKWVEFKKKYRKELEGNPAMATLVEMARNEDITLIYATKEEKYNNAVVLAEAVREALKRPPEG